jgi:hypothetical protein
MKGKNESDRTVIDWRNLAGAQMESTGHVPTHDCPYVGNTPRR